MCHKLVINVVSSCQGKDLKLGKCGDLNVPWAAFATLCRAVVRDLRHIPSYSPSSGGCTDVHRWANDSRKGSESIARMKLKHAKTSKKGGQRLITQWAVS